MSGPAFATKWVEEFAHQQVADGKPACWWQLERLDAMAKGNRTKRATNDDGTNAEANDRGSEDRQRMGEHETMRAAQG